MNLILLYLCFFYAANEEDIKNAVISTILEAKEDKSPIALNAHFKRIYFDYMKSQQTCAHETAIRYSPAQPSNFETIMLQCCQKPEEGSCFCKEHQKFSNCSFFCTVPTCRSLVETKDSFCNMHNKMINKFNEEQKNAAIHNLNEFAQAFKEEKNKAHFIFFIIILLFLSVFFYAIYFFIYFFAFIINFF